MTCTAIGDSSAILCKLQRREDGVGLTDACLQRITYTPLLTGVIHVVRFVGHVARGLYKLYACRGSESELVSIFSEFGNTEVVDYGIEEIVAGMKQCVGNIKFSVCVAERPDPAFRRIACGGVSCENSLTLYFLFCIDNTF